MSTQENGDWAAVELDTILNNDEHDSDDDDDFLVVSTTQQKWERLHRVSTTTASDGGSTTLDEYDDIMVVRTKPARPIRDNTPTFVKVRMAFRQVPLQHVGAMSFLFAAILFWLYSRRKSRREDAFVKPSIGEKSMQQPVTIKASTTAITEIEISTTTTTTTIIAESAAAATTTTAETQSNVATTDLPDDVSSQQSELRSVCLPEDTLMLKNSTEQMQIPTNRSTQQSTTVIRGSDIEKLRMARQLAHDIQVVQQALEEQSLDPALAPQLAVSLQSSRHLVDSQREIHFQHALFTSHQRQLDRQLSERQHRESLQACKYDPNWQEKLWQLRTECWNVSDGLLRPWWEVFLVQQVVGGVLPVWKHYYYYYGGNLNLIEQPHSTMLQDLAWSVLAQVCDCHHQRDQPLVTIIDDSKASWTSTLAAYSAAATSNITQALSGTLILLKYLVPTWIAWDHCSCYGFCFVWAMVVGLATTTAHYLLRILHLPSLLHHIINGMALIAWVGPHRIEWGIWNTAATLMAVPLQEANARYLTEFALILSILVFLPVFNGWRTHVLHRRSHQQISKVETSEFETAFRQGQERLERWKWEQTVVRYLLLLVYASSIAGESGAAH